MKFSRLIHSPSMGAEAGFSLFESLVTILLVAVVTASAVVNFPELSRSFNRQNTRELLRADIRRMKDEAAREGARGIIIFAADNTSYTYGIDYSPYSVALPPVLDKTLGVRRLATGFTISAATPLYFNSRGILVTSGGAVTSVALTMDDSEETFFSGTVYSTGALY